MKLKLFLTIAICCLFSFNVYALEVNNVDIIVSIEDSGKANISENWSITKNTYYEKTFYNDFTILDIALASEKTSFAQVDSCSNLSINSFALIDNTLCFMASNNLVTINYKTSGFINKYKDISGFEWTILDNKDFSIKNLSLSIKLSQNIDKYNTSLYVIGKKIDVLVEEGQINLSTNDLKRNQKIILMGTFNDIEFDESEVVNESFQEHYENIKRSSSLIIKMLNTIKEQILIIVIILIVLISLIIIIIKLNIIIKNKDYKNIIAPKEELKPANEVVYFVDIPCNNDLLEIFFIADYYHLLKNRSDLIGSFILKWVYEGYMSIDEENKCLTINNGEPENNREKELFNIFKSASTNNKIDELKVNIYLRENYNVIINWYKNIINDTLQKEQRLGHLVPFTKFGKTKFNLQTSILTEANRIQGLKRYLLNFNQVPRGSELTIDTYKYLLIVANMLGIGKDVSKEILRKNKENIMALKMASLNRISSIYNDIFKNSSTYYRATIKMFKYKKRKKTT